MSQAGVVNTSITVNPSVPTSFVEDVGTATPAANILQIRGGIGITTTGGGNLVTITNTSPAGDLTFDTDSTLATSSGNTITFHGAGGLLFSGSGSTVTGTLAAIPNASLANSSITITPGLGLAGGGAVSLGGTVSLAMIANSLTVVAGTGLSGGGLVTLGGSVTLSTSTTGVVGTLTADVGTATPVANNIQIAGGPGVTTTASGAVVIINSVLFTDTTATTLVVDNGYFATAAGTYALPITAAQGEMLVVVCDTAGAVILDAPVGNFIRVGSAITSSGGTATSNAIGDSLTLRYRFSSLTWEATSVIGTWSLA